MYASKNISGISYTFALIRADCQDLEGGVYSDGIYEISWTGLERRLVMSSC